MYALNFVEDRADSVTSTGVVAASLFRECGATADCLRSFVKLVRVADDLMFGRVMSWGCVKFML